jgi:hypothetical protein
VPQVGFSCNFIFLFRFLDIVQFWLKSDENNRHFKQRPIYMLVIGHYIEDRLCSFSGTEWSLRKDRCFEHDMLYDTSTENRMLCPLQHEKQYLCMRCKKYDISAFMHEDGKTQPKRP